jgi:hypothetical protein
VSDDAGFKQCFGCGRTWGDLREFITDPRLTLHSYQTRFEDPEQGLIFVTHDIPGCGTTFAITAGLLRPLYRGPVWQECHKAQEDCLLLCVAPGQLEECDAECSMAWVRHALQYLRRHEWPQELDE